MPELTTWDVMLQHVTLEVEPGDAERTIELLELCGLERIEPPGGLGEGYAWLERGGTQIHLELREGAVAPPRGHAALVVEKHAELLERLRERGFEVRPTRELWGAPRAFASLPGGGRIELMAWPPPPSAGGSGSPAAPGPASPSGSS